MSGHGFGLMMNHYFCSSCKIDGEEFTTESTSAKPRTALMNLHGDGGVLMLGAINFMKIGKKGKCYLQRIAASFQLFWFREITICSLKSATLIYLKLRNYYF